MTSKRPCGAPVPIAPPSARPPSFSASFRGSPEAQRSAGRVPKANPVASETSAVKADDALD